MDALCAVLLLCALGAIALLIVVNGSLSRRLRCAVSMLRWVNHHVVLTGQMGAAINSFVRKEDE